jgi:hypothetical protein
MNMSSRTEIFDADEELQASPRVNINIKDHHNPAAHAPFLKLVSPPFEAGKKTDPGSHYIRLKNLTSHNVRFCFVARDGEPLANYIVSPLNPDTDATKGWVQLAPGGPPTTMVLSDAAFDANPPVERRIGISATKLGATQSCEFEDGDQPPEDIVIDAGT